jgi:site-specific DNA-methyltransferase (adenine-specific)
MIVQHNEQMFREFAESFARKSAVCETSPMHHNQRNIIKSRLAYTGSSPDAFLFQANCLEMMDSIIKKYPDGCFDMIFADPPYFLSNGGFTCKGGKMVSVHKGDWDKSEGAEVNHEFNRQWLMRCQKLLKSNGTMWVSGTMHVIYSIGYAMQQLGFKMLNDTISNQFKVLNTPNLTGWNLRLIIHTILNQLKTSYGSRAR